MKITDEKLDFQDCPEVRGLDFLEKHKDSFSPQLWAKLERRRAELRRFEERRRG